MDTVGRAPAESAKPKQESGRLEGTEDESEKLITETKAQNIQLLKELANSLLAPSSNSKSRNYMRIKATKIITTHSFRMVRDDRKPITLFCCSCGSKLRGIVRCSDCGNPTR